MFRPYSVAPLSPFCFILIYVKKRKKKGQVRSGSLSLYIYSALSSFSFPPTSFFFFFNQLAADLLAAGSNKSGTYSLSSLPRSPFLSLCFYSKIFWGFRVQMSYFLGQIRYSLFSPSSCIWGFGFEARKVLYLKKIDKTTQKKKIVRYIFISRYTTISRYTYVYRPIHSQKRYNQRYISKCLRDDTYCVLYDIYYHEPVTFSTIMYLYFLITS